jgi:two-component system response regulator VicR
MDEGKDKPKTGPDRRKILVVDDEPNVRRLLRAVLRKKFTVVEATDGAQAVEIAVVEKPDLILMDIMMPRMDGYSCCCALKKKPATSSIPVIMLTALDLKPNRQLSKEIGARGYISKPFNSKDLLSNIDRLVPTV